MSKGIATQTILLLLVGMIVVGILIYLVYSYTKSSTLSKTECLARITSWCTTCLVSGWSNGVSIPPEVKTCGGDVFGSWWTDNTDCLNIGTQSDCKTAVGVE